MEPTIVGGLAAVGAQVAETSPADAKGTEALPMGRLESTEKGSRQWCHAVAEPEFCSWVFPLFLKKSTK
jgi:hypothetical protein